MVMLDVLIIGSGPHALTLASLLSSPDPDPDSDHEGDPPFSTSSSGSDPLRSQAGPENTKNKLFTGRRKRRTTSVMSAGQMMEEVNTSSEWAAPPSLNVLVVDTYGEWTALWESQFTALNIPHLRSHTLVHTDPLNKNSLQEFALKHDRSDELHPLPEQIYILDENAFFNDMRLGKKEKKRLNVKSSLKKTLSLRLPGTKLSVDFFTDQVKRYKLDKILQKGTVEQIVPVTEQTTKEREEETGDTPIIDTGSKEGGARRRVKYFQVHLQDGQILKARRVVMATGPTRAQMSNIPMWVKHIEEKYPEERLQHTVRLMHQKPNYKQKLKETNGQKQSKDLFSGVCEAGQRVMVVGGGLTSAHVVSLALQQGASQVTWVMRKHLQLKQFDVGDVESLVGRYSHVEHGIKMDGQAYLRQFYNERSLHKRLTMIRQARKGGAITPEAYVHLQPFIQNGQVELKTFCQVNEASWCYRTQSWNLSLSSGDRWTGDTIWLATGCKLDVRQDPLLSEVMREFPIQVIDGWPCITEGLQWTEECPLYLMGQYSALQVGPHAVNLAGGQAASMRITKDIIHHQIQNSRLVPDMNGGKSKTEEYIQQMQGLFWL